jgi:L-lactate utilization protein LutC
VNRLARKSFLMNERNNNHNGDSRGKILASIRQHLAASAPHDAIRAEHHLHAAHAATVAPLSSHSKDAAALLDRFRTGLEAVGGRCLFAGNKSEAAAAVQQIIAQSKARRVALSDSPLIKQIVNDVDADVVWLERAPAGELFDCEIGISGAQRAIAETSTLVIETDAEFNRLCSLVPPIHIAIIEADRIQATLGDVLRSLNQSGKDSLSRAITFITGPSRTSDIELTLAIGVHGPQELHVVILGEK